MAVAIFMSQTLYQWGKEPWVVHTRKETGWTLDPGRKRWRKIFVS